MRKVLGPRHGLALGHRVLKWGSQEAGDVGTGGQVQRAVSSTGDPVPSTANDHILCSSDHIPNPRVCLGNSSGATHARREGAKAE